MNCREIHENLRSPSTNFHCQPIFFFAQHPRQQFKAASHFNNRFHNLMSTLYHAIMYTTLNHTLPFLNAITTSNYLSQDFVTERTITNRKKRDHKTKNCLVKKTSPIFFFFLSFLFVRR